MIQVMSSKNFPIAENEGIPAKGCTKLSPYLKDFINKHTFYCQYLSRNKQMIYLERKHINPSSPNKRLKSMGSACYLLFRIVKLDQSVENVTIPRNQGVHIVL